MIPVVQLSPDSFPFTLEFYTLADGEVVHTIVVTGPGPLHIPVLIDKHGPVGCRTIRDGQVTSAWPPEGF